MRDQENVETLRLRRGSRDSTGSFAPAEAVSSDSGPFDRVRYNMGQRSETSPAATA
jgi:hypothetical protein